MNNIMKTLGVLLVVAACLALASADQSSGGKNRKENGKLIKAAGSLYP